MKLPCERDCPNRSPSCHAECEKYLSWHKERLKKYAENLKELDIKDYEHKHADKIKKKLKKGVKQKW